MKAVGQFRRAMSDEVRPDHNIISYGDPGEDTAAPSVTADAIEDDGSALFAVSDFSEPMTGWRCHERGRHTGVAVDDELEQRRPIDDWHREVDRTIEVLIWRFRHYPKTGKIERLHARDDRATGSPDGRPCLMINRLSAPPWTRIGTYRSCRLTPQRAVPIPTTISTAATARCIRAGFRIRPPAVPGTPPLRPDTGGCRLGNERQEGRSPVD